MTTPHKSPGRPGSVSKVTPGSAKSGAAVADQLCNTLSVKIFFDGAQDDTPDKIFMNPKDMKRLSLRIGSFVIIETTCPPIILACWPNKTIAPNQACCHSFWREQFSAVSSRTTHLVTNQTASVQRIRCAEIMLGILFNSVGQDNIRTYETSSEFSSYLNVHLSKLLLVDGQLLSITWMGKPLIIQVNILPSDQSVNDSKSETTDLIQEFDKIAIMTPEKRDSSPSLSFYYLTPSTLFKFRAIDKDSLPDKTRTPKLGSAKTPSVSRQSPLRDTTPTRLSAEFDLELPSDDTNRTPSSTVIRDSLTISKTAPIQAFVGYDAEVRLAKETIVLAFGNAAVDNYQQGGVARLKSFVSEVFRPPKGLLIHGPPGTGKTTLMKKLVSDFGYPYFEISSSILLCRSLGDAEKLLHQIFSDARARSPSFILMDDLHRICPHRGGNSQAQTASTMQVSEQHRSLISSLLTLIDGVGNFSTGVFLIATSAFPQSIDSAMRRPGRLDVEVELSVPSAKDRVEILYDIVSSRHVGIRFEGSEVRKEDSPGNSIDRRVIESIAAHCHGMVASDLIRVVKEACIIHIDRELKSKLATSQTDDQANIRDHLGFSNLQLLSRSGALHQTADNHIVLSKDELMAAMREVNPSALREVSIEVPSVKWTDIGGMESVKQCLKEVVEWPLQFPQLFESMGISPPRGVLLYGPPGCSKTLMAKALATESSMNFLAVRGPELLSKWLGESEKAVQKLFARARAAAPSIIFFDEIDALATKRGTSSAGVNDRVLAQLLAELDGIHVRNQVIVVAATNRPDLLDEALIRPGRIDRKIYVPPPDSESRQQIISINIRKVPTSDAVVTDEGIQKLVSATSGFSGAEVVSIVQDAAMVCIDRQAVQMELEDLLDAAAAVKPQITPAMISFYADLQQRFN